MADIMAGNFSPVLPSTCRQRHKKRFFFAKNAPANKLDRCHGKVFSAD